MLNVKIVSGVWAQTGSSIRLGHDIEKVLDPVFVYIRGTTKLFEFVECIYFEHLGETSKSVRYAVWLSFRVRKIIVHILKSM